ncbi:hypothetical protein CABS01_10835 [Colletotrichum abscissum]|uniref:uncharacterized protein n=1 Tax=Colletotrichum abscissum TaxID=1671311 RepID=UPI0027D4B3BB|nr:uncharacterized protein CABS01_10835 [Colletotrichum abscissum]KAK1497857.1 hypothetical protein CABS01_10835 [Colletotrichum abscissum]
MVMRRGRTGWSKVGDAVFTYYRPWLAWGVGWLAAGKMRGDRKASGPCRTAFGSRWREREFTAKAKQSTLVPFSDENRRHGHDLGIRKMEGGQALDKGQNKRARVKRERDGRDKKRADGTTGQRNRATGDTGGRRRDETRREREKKRGWKGAEREREKEQQPAPAKAPPRKYTRRSKRRRQRCQGRYGTYSVYPVAHPRTRLRVTRSKQVVQCVERGAWSEARVPRQGGSSKDLWIIFFPLHPHPLGFLDSPPRVNPLPQVCAGCCCCCYYS